VLDVTLLQIDRVAMAWRNDRRGSRAGNGAGRQCWRAISSLVRSHRHYPTITHMSRMTARSSALCG
jgi:hypothetical protein